MQNTINVPYFELNLSLIYVTNQVILLRFWMMHLSLNTIFSDIIANKSMITLHFILCAVSVMD